MTDRRETVNRSEEQLPDDVRIDELERNQGLVNDKILGPKELDQDGKPILDLDGAPIRRTKEGMDHKVNWMYGEMSNGGIRIKLPPGAWVAIIVAIVTGLFNIAAAVAGGG